MIILRELNGDNRRLGCMMTAIFQILPKKNTFKHTRNMVNNYGGRAEGHRPWVLGTLIYEGVKLEKFAKILFNVGFSFFLVFPSPK